MERYTELKNSVQALRSEVRRGSSLSSEQARTCGNAGKIGLPFDTKASKESAAVKLLELQLNTLDQERQEELATTQKKVTEKLKQLESLRSKFERQIKRLEDGYFSVKDAVRTFENYTCERLMLAERDFACLEAQVESRHRDFENETRKNEREHAAQYEHMLEALNRKHDEDGASRKVLEENIKRMVHEKDVLQERNFLLVQEQKTRKEDFRNKYKQLERLWMNKMTSAAIAHEEEMNALRSTMEKEKSKVEAEKLDLVVEFQEYKNEKMREISCLEEHIKGVLQIKDSKISQLSDEIQKLQQLLREIGSDADQQ